jgi:hypothetical protein
MSFLTCFWDDLLSPLKVYFNSNYTFCYSVLPLAWILLILDASIKVAPLHFGNIISCHDSDPWLEGNFVSPLSYQHWDNATWVSSASPGLLPGSLFLIISNPPLSLSTLIWNQVSQCCCLSYAYYIAKCCILPFSMGCKVKSLDFFYDILWSRVRVRVMPLLLPGLHMWFPLSTFQDWACLSVVRKLVHDLFWWGSSPCLGLHKDPIDPILTLQYLP